jgi:hypothetical protein
VGKKVTRKDESIVFGLSAAANFLECAEGTVVNHANAGRLPHTRDSSGKRLFTLSELRKFKRSNQLGSNRRLPGDARSVRSA